MKRMLVLAAMLAACRIATVAAADAPLAGSDIEVAMKGLDARVEAQTLAKMQGLVERDATAHGLLQQDASRVLAMALPTSRSFAF